MTKKISVIMGIYNCADTLPFAIESILKQTYENWELILCDDCSTDGRTYELAKQYEAQYPQKIIVIRNQCNKKLAYSLNQCLKKATGTYVARMDADDLSVPTRFERQVDYLEKHPDVNLVGCSMQRFNREQGNIDVIYKPEHPDKYTMRYDLPFNHATIMTYKYVYERLGGYTVSKRTERGQDYDLWFRFFKEGFSGDNLTEPLYRVLEDKAAIRRRTAKVRFRTLQTTYYGFRLLNFPSWWLLRPTIITIMKSLTPYFIIDRYRCFQGKHRS